MNLCLKCEILICEHLVIHFITNRPCVYRLLTVKATDVTQVRYKPYLTIDITDFSNDLVFDNLV